MQFFRKEKKCYNAPKSEKGYAAHLLTEAAVKFNLKISAFSKKLFNWMISVTLLECFNYLLRKSYIQEIRKTNEAKKFKLENQDLL
jgi:hypothetical protein